MRAWRDNSGLKVYDVGSHSEFFYLNDSKKVKKGNKNERKEN